MHTGPVEYQSDHEVDEYVETAVKFFRIKNKGLKRSFPAADSSTLTTRLIDCLCMTHLIRN